METVAVYSQADSNALHVQLADRAVCIGPARSTASYLKHEVIVQVAKATRCDAIHPGYGFLSENAEFAQACIDNGLIFIGPSPEVIKNMGDKVLGRQFAARLGIPVVEGTEGVNVSFEDVESLGNKAGYPILLKASAGGGGRGMRVVLESKDLQYQYDDAQAEARAAFGDGTVYAERLLQRVRHIEVQIVGDHNGNVVHFGTRDCTIQRRHQKIVEEAPATYISEASRERICADAVRLASDLSYAGAGTVEFVVDMETGKHYFIEVNTRIQVEHPVTEMISGVDLVREQLHAADPTDSLSIRQEEVALRGHAIEVRINAEDPDKSFAPCPGAITRMRLPGGPGVRFDSHCYPGYVVSPFYDSMIAKLIVHDINRDWALRRVRRSLGELQIDGVTTNTKFLHWLLGLPEVIENQMTTTWLESTMSATDLAI